MGELKHFLLFSRCDGDLVRRRPCGAEAVELLAGFSRRYEAIVKKQAWDELMPLGREIFVWLDGDGWLKALKGGTGQRRLELAVGGIPMSLAKHFWMSPGSC